MLIVRTSLIEHDKVNVKLKCNFTNQIDSTITRWSNLSFAITCEAVGYFFSLFLSKNTNTFAMMAIIFVYKTVKNFTALQSWNQCT